VTLDPNRSERAIVERMRALKAAGYTLRAIAAELNRQGLTTRKGTAWQHQYVAAALRATAGGPAHPLLAAA
jgi:recombinase